MQSSVDVVGAHQRDVELLRKTHEHRVCSLLLLESVVLQLEVVPVAEDGLEPCSPLLRRFPLVVEQVLQDFASQTCRQADQVVAVARQYLVVDPGLVVEALGVGKRGELHQVVVAVVVHRQKDQMVHVVMPLRHRARVPSVAGVHVELASYDGLDACRLACLVELQRAVHVAVVGDGQCIHAAFLAPGDV